MSDDLPPCHELLGSDGGSVVVRARAVSWEERTDAVAKSLRQLLDVVQAVHAHRPTSLFQHALEVANLLRPQQRVRAARATGTRGAAYTVDVRLQINRRVVADDSLDALCGIAEA